MKNPKKVKIGKKNRASGAAFELRVRKNLEDKGWIVDKWGNQVEFPDTKNIDIPGELDIIKNYGKLIPAKRKWNNFTKTMMMGSGGMPDFIAFRYCPDAGENGYEYKKDFPLIKSEDNDSFDELHARHILIGVEVKSNGILTKLEKQKCQWLLDNQVFSKILIAEKTKVKNRVVIVYHDFTERYSQNINKANDRNDHEVDNG